jgi:tetratricopeptide (TPR) repeat protein
LDTAKSTLEKVKDLLEEAEKNQNPYYRGKVDYLVNLGAVYQYNCDESLQGLLEALQLLEQFSYPKGLIQTLNGIAWFYYVMGDFVNAKTYIERCILVAEDFNDPVQLYKTYNVAGVILSEINELDRAIKYLQFMIDYIMGQEENKDRGVAYNNLAMILAENGELDKAEEAGLTGLKYARQDELPLSEACVLDTLGMIYKGKGDLDQSIYYFTEAIKIFHSFKDVGLDFEPYLNLGEVLLIKGDLVEAEKNLETALEMVKRMPGSRLEYACYEKLAELHEKKGEFTQAIEFYKEFHKKKEKIFNQQNMQQIANLVSAHKVENALKDAKILELTNASLRQEIETQKQQRAELERQATTDPLTGLINRRHFHTLGQFEFLNARKKVWIFLWPCWMWIILRPSMTGSGTRWAIRFWYGWPLRSIQRFAMKI